MAMTAPTREGVRETAHAIRPHIRKTPVIETDGAAFGAAGTKIVFKLELLQHAGSFKARGAFANLLLRDPPAAGVAAASGGNHGAAVAYAAKALGLKAKIFVPEISSPAKIARIRSYGADLAIGGAVYADALAACNAHIAETGAMSVHAYDSAETMLGAGTLGLELEEQAGPLDAVLVAVGGGGLLGGVATWLDGRTPLVAVEPETCPCFARARAAGAPVDAPVGGIAADSLGASRLGATSFAAANPFVSESILVSDDAIRAAQKALWDGLRIVAEPGGAAAFAALHSGAFRPPAGARIGVVISGGNTGALPAKAEAGSPPGNAPDQDSRSPSTKR